MRRVVNGLLLAGVLSICSLHSPPAEALYQQYPGTLCEAATGSETYLRVTGESSVYNGSSSNYATLICPLIRTGPTGNINQVWMMVHDQNSTANVSCSLYCRDDNTTMTAFDTDTSSGTGTYQQLNFAPPTDWDYGACYVRCLLPPAPSLPSYIISYYEGV